MQPRWTMIDNARSQHRAKQQQQVEVAAASIVCFGSNLLRDGEREREELERDSDSKIYRKKESRIDLEWAKFIEEVEWLNFSQSMTAEMLATICWCSSKLGFFSK